jgi:PmbA protein
MSTKPVDNYKDIVDYAVSQSKKLGANACCAVFSKRENNKIVFRDGVYEEIKGSTTQYLNVKLYVDGKYAIHKTSDLKKASVKKFLTEAISLTKYLMKDKYRKLAGPELYKNRSKADLKLYDKAIDSLTLDKKKKIVKKVFEISKKDAGKHFVSAASVFGDSKSMFYQGHSDGFAGSEKKTTFYLYSDVSVKDSKGKRPSDYDSTVSRTFAGLKDFEKLGKEAAKRAVLRIGAEKIKSEKLQILVENRALRRILFGLLSPLNGSSISNKRSCFEDSIGKEMFSKLFTMTDNPLMIEGLNSFRFDSEGISSKKMDIIKNGVLKNFYIDSYYGTKLNKTITTGSKSNIVFEQGKKDLNGLMAGIKRGILIDRFIGGNSNSTTGDFSHGIGGFLIENGKISKPVIELNIAGNHKTFWKNIIETGNDPYKASSFQTPSILFKPILIAGK